MLDKTPAVHATITAARADGASVRAALSGSDGVYSFADLPAGTWFLSAKLDNYTRTNPALVEIVAGDASRCDIRFRGPAPVPGAAPNSQTGSSLNPAAPVSPVAAKARVIRRRFKLRKLCDRVS